MASSILLVFILSHFMVRWPTEAQMLIGCFSFNHGNTVLSVKTQEGIGSIAACIQQCQNRRVTYAGIRYGHVCYCGDNHDHTVNGMQLSDSRCTTSCNDQLRLCGDTESIVIYSVCNRGRYYDNTTADHNCGASCNCTDNNICLYRSGSCPVNCETGRRAEACNVRVVQTTTEAATQTRETDHGVTVADSDSSDTHSHPEIGISVGVSLAAFVLIVVAGLIVYFRKRRTDRQSDGRYHETKSIQETDTATQAKADPLMEQAECDPTTTSSTAPPMLNYSTVDFSNNCPVHIDGEDISKSDDDVVIHGNHEKVEYAVVRKTPDTTHANLKNNSLYGTQNGDSDEENVE